MNTALLTEGTHELKVIDTKGSEGIFQVTIANRVIEVTPLKARPRDVITITGRAFIADNPDGLSETIDLKYQCDVDSRTTTADADASGNFTETLQVPNNCAIPSTNTITAEISAGGFKTGVVKTVTHQIPDAVVRLEPASGPSGSIVKVTGEGFRTFETVGKVEIGGRGTLGGRTVNTDANGNFTIPDVVVPGLDPGIHSVKVEVSTGTRRTTASSSFTVTAPAAGLPPVTTVAPATALAPLGANLVRVWGYDGATQRFRLYDPAAALLSDLTLLTRGQGYWINVKAAQTVVLGTGTYSLSAGWNLIGWLG
jgi:hypothetical protein